jgi:hypothetical protein
VDKFAEDWNKLIEQKWQKRRKYKDCNKNTLQ